ncbi:RmlC-like cupin domain-containing protein [Trichoderma compactum]
MIYYSRQTLRLTHTPTYAPYTTDTVYAGLQLVMPNETAPAHRHTAFAMRFIIEGNDSFTAVNGRRIKMNRGDVILTATWNRHDHVKDGSGPMIWLDGLDLPNFRHFPVHFVEHYDKPRYPGEDVDTDKSPIVFLWAKMQARLDAEDGDWITKAYLKGDVMSKILSGSAERLNAGTSSPEICETASSVYHIVEGSGHSIIDGKIFKWHKGDTLCIPAWNKYQHVASGESTLYLYWFNNKPMLRALGILRTEGVDVCTRLVGAA